MKLNEFIVKQCQLLFRFEREYHKRSRKEELAFEMEESEWHNEFELWEHYNETNNSER